jgi:sporulation protein YlmC with PRC-barrel domain
MLTSASELRAMEVWASDGRVGVVDDLYIEDGQGAIRYFVVDTGGWLMGQRVLVASAAVTGVDHITAGRSR